MRKMKKINGFLVVRFNDREKAGYPTLGNFGVIDAELYTGSIDIDRDAFEYDDADTIEAAAEQARGLDAEEDFADEPPVYTVVVETAEEVKEEEVEPQLLIDGWERQLETQIKSPHYKDVDPRTAAHELYGYKAALCDLGLIDREDRAVDPDHFAPGMTERPLPRNSEEFLSYICDEVCRQRLPGRTQEELDAVCAKCSVERLASEADDRELRTHGKAAQELNDLIGQLRDTPLNTKAERLEHEARAYLRALEVTQMVTERESAAFIAAIEDALASRPYTMARNNFENLHPGIKGDPITRKVYALGLVLAEECPDNDCKLYLNIFNAARKLDAALDEVEPNESPALALRGALLDRVKELGNMYLENYAIQKFKEGLKP